MLPYFRRESNATSRCYFATMLYKHRFWLSYCTAPPFRPWRHLMRPVSFILFQPTRRDACCCYVGQRWVIAPLRCDLPVRSCVPPRLQWPMAALMYFHFSSRAIGGIGTQSAFLPYCYNNITSRLIFSNALPPSASKQFYQYNTSVRIF